MRGTERANIQQQSLRGQNILSRAVLFWGRRMSFVCCREPLHIGDRAAVLGRKTADATAMDEDLSGDIDRHDLLDADLGHVFPGLGGRNVDVDAAAGVVQHVDIKAG